MWKAALAGKSSELLKDGKIKEIRLKALSCFSCLKRYSGAV